MKIKCLKNNKSLPVYQTSGSSGMDLTAGIDEEIEIKPLERKLIPTGISIELPQGFEAQVRARSGMSVKHGITLINAIGTIDSDYRGEICVGLINLSSEPYTIKPNDRIAQMVIMKVEHAEIEIETELSQTLRGSGGFGSTGY